jgi:oligopeptide/dipeptide ABC transporter ATP-binding protein
MTEPLLEVSNLSVGYPTPAGMFQAVRGVDLRVGRGELLGLVGESGSGKTTLGLSIIGLIPEPGRILEGDIFLEGQSIVSQGVEARRRMRGEKVSMVFQNPMSSLNPTMMIGAQIGEGIRAHRDLSESAIRDRSIELLELVGLADPARRLAAYPHELSGGMRQRVMIAMAVALDPLLLIADEPTTALDVTIQAQIIWLLEDLRERLGMAIVYITHNLAVAANICQSIAVCYGGEIVEHATRDVLFADPAHPYTRNLIEAVPKESWRSHRIKPGGGLPPAAIGPRESCVYRRRCPWAYAHCEAEAPALRPIAPSHDVRCFVYEDREQLALRRPGYG